MNILLDSREKSKTDTEFTKIDTLEYCTLLDIYVFRLIIRALFTSQG